MAIFFWSDMHFNHEGIIGFCNRKYDSVVGMNEVLIANWNAAIGEKDDIFVLGDFAFGKMDEIGPIFDRLDGHKHLVIGNHDQKNKAVLRLPWESQMMLGEVRENGERIVVCHYPIENWASSHYGVPHCHGHSHGMSRPRPRRFDVGVDVENFPVSFAQILNRSAQAPMPLKEDV